MKNWTREEKIELLLTTIVCLIPLVAGLILYPQLPDKIVTHWDINGNPNGWSNKTTGILILPLSMVVLNILFPFLLRVDPKYENMDAKLKAVAHWSIPVIAVCCSGGTLAAAMGKSVRIEVIIPMIVGAVLVLIGNYLPKTKQSYTMGIKLPWTLNSEENWNHTHRFGGYVWVIGGLLIMISPLISSNGVIMFAGIIIAVLLPCIYSYLYYLKEKKEQ